MEYREIVSVTGIGGLYQLLATKSDGAIVKNLADKSTKFISARLHNVTPLESIEIYTTAANVRLHEILQKMKESAAKMPDTKTAKNDAIKSYFKEVYPELDEERVYVSDMKKILKWYDILKANELLNFEAYNQAAMQSEEEETQPEEKEEKPVKKTVAKKTAEKKEDENEKEIKEKPAKKTAAKKITAKKEAGEVKEKPAKKAAKKKAE